MRKCWSSVFVVFPFHPFCRRRGFISRVRCHCWWVYFSPTIHLPLCPMLIIDGRFFCCYRSDLVWKMIGDSFLIWMLMESFVYPVLYSWLLSVSSRALPHSRWVSVTDFYVRFESLFVISTMFCCGIVVFCRVNWLLYSQVCILSSLFAVALGVSCTVCCATEFIW
jgi:hypothetical protein